MKSVVGIDRLGSNITGIKFGSSVLTGVIKSILHFSGFDTTAAPTTNPEDTAFNTTADGKQAFLVLGNSTSSFASSGGPGIAPTAGTAFEWDGAALNNLGTSFTNSGSAGSNKGDWSTNFSTLYNTQSGRKPCFSDSHVFGSLLYSSATSTGFWIGPSFVKGSYYTAMKTKGDSLLANIGLTQFKAILLFDILVNDATAGAPETVANVDTAYRALLTFLQTDYPGSPIYVVGMAIDSSGAQTQRVYQLRMNGLIALDSYTGVHSWYAGGYAFPLGNMSGKHWNQAQNDAMGRSLNDFLLDYTTTDWDARRIRNQFYNQLTVLQRGYVSTCIASLKAVTNFTKLNYLSTDVHTTDANRAMEWIGTTPSRTDIGAYTFNTKANIQTSGGTPTNGTFQETWLNPGWAFRYGGQDDCFMLTKVGVNSTPAGTVGTLFGPTAASSLSTRQLATSRIEYKCNDNTGSTYLTDTKYADNTWYGVYRSGASLKGLIKGSASVATAAIASAAPSVATVQRGARNVSGQDPIAVTLTGAFAFGQYSSFDFSAFESAMDTFNSNMAL